MKGSDKLPESQIVPTTGFRKEQFFWRPERRWVTIWDMSGQSRYRNLWSHYYDAVLGIVFVVDLADSNRMVMQCYPLPLTMMY